MFTVRKFYVSGQAYTLGSNNNNSVLVGLTGELFDKLQKVQNNTARMLTMLKRHEHITPVLTRLNWLPIHSRIEYKLLLLSFKALNNLAPVYKSELLEYDEQSQYDLRRTLQLV